MATISVIRTIDAPLKDVWGVLADYGNVHTFHPGIVDSKDTGSKIGLGGQRECEFGKGRGVTEEVVAWQVGKHLAFEATAFRKLPMTKMVGKFRFVGDGPTTVEFVMEYRMKGGFIMDLMARGQMKKAGIGMLEGLQSRLETA